MMGSQTYNGGFQKPKLYVTYSKQGPWKQKNAKPLNTPDYSKQSQAGDGII